MGRTERKHPREEDCGECGSPFYCEGVGGCDEKFGRFMEQLFAERRERRRKRRARRGTEWEDGGEE